MRWLFALVLGLASTAALAAEGRKVALLVGVESYQHAKLAALNFCADDVRRLEQILTPQGFECIVLANHHEANAPAVPAAQQPTAANIQRALQAVLYKDGRARVGKDDLVLVVLTGHGLQPVGDPQPYFCPLDANPTVTTDDRGNQSLRFPQTLVGIGNLLQELDDSGVGRKLILVDACRDAPLLKGSKGVDHVAFTLLPAQCGVLLSCSAGEFSFENAQLGPMGRGAFLHHVIEGLEGAAADANGNVTWGRLTTHVTEQVPATVARLYGDLGGRQTPHAIANLSGVVSLGRIGAPRPSPLPLPKPLPVPAPPPSGGGKPSPLSSPFTAAQAKSGQEAWAKSLGKSVVEKNTVGMDLVLIPPGKFRMGSPVGEEGRDDDETQVEVTLTQPFWLARTEVTQGQWESVMGTTPWSGQVYVKEGSDYAATYVSWEDAEEFCRKLSQREGKTYRLPTEAEWEWSCRAGTTTRYSFGDSEGDLGRNGWYGGIVGDGNAKTEQYAHRVGLKLANPFGLSDMHGNVYEWCQDVYVDKLAGGTDPLATSGGSSRVNRGGSWSSTPVYCRSAYRYGDSPGSRGVNLGFRPLAVQSR